jgi:hypothetical protein
MRWPSSNKPVLAELVEALHFFVRKGQKKGQAFDKLRQGGIGA